MTEISATHVKIYVGEPKAVDDVTVFIGYHTTGAGWCDSLAIKTSNISRLVGGSPNRFRALIVANNATIKGFPKPGDAAAFAASFKAGDIFDGVKAIDYKFAAAYRP